MTRRYIDPLDAVWLGVAAGVGMQVQRSDSSYASTDGQGTLFIGTPDTLDADDCLAQMIFHELCHAIVQGPDSFHRADWGLDNTDARDIIREHACLRVQAALAQAYQLRTFFAPTTKFRAYYDALPVDPLHDHTDHTNHTQHHDLAIALAQTQMQNALCAPWHPHLRHGLRATQTIVTTVIPFLAGKTHTTFF